MTIAARFSPLDGGVWIEASASQAPTDSTRCFRFDSDGNAEYSVYSDLVNNGGHARWYGHCYKLKDFALHQT